ncbi:MAG: hypothetical protein ACXWMI_02170, partial [Syntrophales bacterium]
ERWSRRDALTLVPCGVWVQMPVPHTKNRSYEGGYEMNGLSKDMKRKAVKDIKVYFGRPTYDVEYIRRSYGSSDDLLDQRALAKYGRTLPELIRELQAVYMTEKTKSEAFPVLKIYPGELPVTKETLPHRLASGLCEMQVQAKYFMPVDDLMKQVGFEVVE